MKPGVQTPGFMGHGKHFIASKKFIAAEGGLGRIVWLPKELKEQMREKLDAAVALACKDDLAELDATGSLCPTQKGWLLGNELFGIMWDTAGD